MFLTLTGCLKISIGNDNPDNPQENICPDQPKTALTSKNTETIVLTDQPLNKSKQVTSTKMVGYTFNAQSGQKLELSIDDDVCEWLYAPDGQLITNSELTQTGQYTLQLSTIKGSKTVNLNINFASNVVATSPTAIAPAPSTPTVRQSLNPSTPAYTPPPPAYTPPPPTNTLQNYIWVSQSGLTRVNNLDQICQGNSTLNSVQTVFGYNKPPFLGSISISNPKTGGCNRGEVFYGYFDLAGNAGHCMGNVTINWGNNNNAYFYWTITNLGSTCPMGTANWEINTYPVAN